MRPPMKTAGFFPCQFGSQIVQQRRQA
jgi:hypothetical protein